MTFTTWNERNPGVYSARRNLRYATDPAYRASVIESNRAARAAKRKARLAAEEQAARLGHVPERAWPVYEREDANGVVTRYHTVGGVCSLLSLSKVTLRSWEKRGDVPKPTERSESGEFLYSDAHVDILRKAIADHPQLNHKEPELERDVVITLRDGTRRTERAFKVGGLSARVKRQAAAISKLERRGCIPLTPFLSPDGRKLYTERMAEAMAQALSRVIRVRTETDKAVIYKELSPVWAQYAGATIAWGTDG